MSTSPSPSTHLPLPLPLLRTLTQHTASTIADALNALHIPNAGFLADLTPITLGPPTQEITIARASTVVMASLTTGPNHSVYAGEANIPPGEHWADRTEPDSIVVIAQPEGQRCAVLGGIVALRMGVCGARGLVVCGRVRDVEELGAANMPIWAKATSIVGSAAECKPYAIQVPLNIDGTIVTPGDIIFSDAVNGVVVIPQDKLQEVISMLPGLVEADERVKEDVRKGMMVREAFKRHRG